MLIVIYEKGHSANVALRVMGGVWRFHLLEKTLAPNIRS
jgi:hypothetical protein